MFPFISLETNSLPKKKSRFSDSKNRLFYKLVSIIKSYIEKITSRSECTVDLDDVLDAVNDGRSFLNYRGEGWSSGWQASCYNFQTSDVSGLNNGERFTFVTSIGCGVAMFDTWGDNNCFGEE
ncbi:MAG: hypothetical protein HGB26_08820, partial [Desulfobulbaceae bacterium]|nr:hypothetical protein [Desulfobulbaceae bacterium]